MKSVERLTRERDFAIETTKMLEERLEEHFGNYHQMYLAYQLVSRRNYVLDHRMNEEFPYWEPPKNES